MADNIPPSRAGVTESGSLNLPEPSGLHRPVMGLLYFMHVYLYCIGSQELSSSWVTLKGNLMSINMKKWRNYPTSIHLFLGFFCIHRRILLLLELSCPHVLCFSVVNHMLVRVYESISDSERRLTTKLHRY
jgi:hypothetical protein